MTVTATSFTREDLEQLVAVRRDLHAHPELAFEEVRTSALVAERLRGFGLDVRTGVGKTGVLATVKGGKPGKTVLLRADMDALPIQEENAVPYRSQNDGKMHACGHDCHTSILLGVSRRLQESAATLPGAVKLCFQPAEENGGGAAAMIKDGVLEQPKPDAAFGLHVWQDLDLGQVGITPGPFMAAVDEFTVTVKGKGAHAAMPHFGVDPVVAIAHVITALQTIASRNVSPLLEVVVSVTQVRAGAAFNIIPETAWMNGTVRVFDPDVEGGRAAPSDRARRRRRARLRSDDRVQAPQRADVNDLAMCAARRRCRGSAGERPRRHSHHGRRGLPGVPPGARRSSPWARTSRGLTWDHHHLRLTFTGLSRDRRRDLASHRPRFLEPRRRSAPSSPLRGSWSVAAAANRPSPIRRSK